MMALFLPAHAAGVPTGAEDAADGVRAVGFDQFGHVIGVVVDSLVVVGPVGSEIVVADGAAVDVQAVHAQGAAINRCTADVALHLEVLAEQRARLVLHVCGGRRLHRAPGAFAQLGALHGGLPTRIVELDGRPIAVGLRRRFPRAVDAMDNRIAFGELDFQLADDSGRVGSFAAVGDNHGQRVLARGQVILDVDGRGTACRHRFAIDEQLVAVVGKDHENRLFDLLAFGNRYGAAEVTFSGRGFFRRP